MIDTHIRVLNPFSRDTGEFNSLAYQVYTVTKTRVLELQLVRRTDELFRFSLDLRFDGSHHAGPVLEFGLFGYEVSASLPDSRHWDYLTNTWADD